jgi:hypothetical protein
MQQCSKEVLFGAKSTAIVAKKTFIHKTNKTRRRLGSKFLYIVAKSQNDCSKNIIFLQCKCSEK